MPPAVVDAPWWVTAFGSEYVAVYGHRDDAEARAHVPFLADALGLASHARVLDLACGTGRYSRALSAAGYRVTGFDFSAELLDVAYHRSPALPGMPTYIRGDMRSLPFFAQFDAVVSLFTSFGYFDEPSDDAKVLEGVARALVPGGKYLVDVAHAAWLRRTLVESSETTQGHRTIRSTRRLDDTRAGGPYVCKHVVIRDDRTDTTLLDVEERVRLYDPERLDAALAAAGLVPTGRAYGDFDGSPLGPDSPRLIRVAERPRGGRAR